MNLTDCKKASIYDLNNLYLLDASVSNFENDTVTLTFNELCSDVLRSEVYITFYDNIQGLITSYCQLSDYKEYLAAPAMWNSQVHCKIEKQISVLQRRNDIKVPVNMKAVLNFANHEDVLMSVSADIRDISAGGLFFTCRYSFPVGQIFEFSFKPKDPGILLNAEIIRIQPLGDNPPGSGEEAVLTGYGCHFIHLSPYKESLIRNYVFQQDIHRKKGRELYI